MKVSYFLLKTLLLAVLVAGIVSSEVKAAEEVHKFASPEHKLLYQELTDELRCPKCQNQNIADSDAGIAKDLRNKVYDLVNEGQSKQQVVDYMVERYGYFVYYKPPVTAGTIVLWLLPVLFALFTMVLIWLKAKKSQLAVIKPQWDDAQEQQLTKLISDIQQPQEN
ncbi:MAG: cytochrome c-type biogenesis protein CcmH [Alteromonadaceae bacterium]|jgi:cytochrome c-type biogenesis protein CcmH